MAVYSSPGHIFLRLASGSSTQQSKMCNDSWNFCSYLYVKFKPKLECSTVGKQTQITNDTPNVYLIKLSNVKIYQEFVKPKSKYLYKKCSFSHLFLFSHLCVHMNFCLSDLVTLLKRAQLWRINWQN